MDIRRKRFEELRKMSNEEVQAEAYALLKRFAALCRKHGLRYTLSGGTCLGAVRHNGFIPWDDDIDIDMPFPDFLRLLKVFRKEKNMEDVWLLYGMQRMCANPWGKLCKRNTLVKSPMRDRAHSQSLWVDILPLFALSDDEDEAQEQLRTIRSAILETHSYLNPHPLFGGAGFRAWFGGKVLGPLRLWLCTRRMQKAALRYPFGSTKYVHSMFIFGNEHEHVRKFPTDMWNHITTHRFEDEEFCIMEDTDTYLRTLYGPDYMTPPPPEERGGHDMEVYCLP